MAQAGNIRAILFQEGGQWVGQCLEYDIGAQAADLDTLQTRLALAIETELRESIARCGSAFAGIPAAPPYFQHLWDRRAGSFHPRHPSSLRHNGELQIELALAA